ncbi:hypothetical protein Tco_1106491 [Tanacetum coccineum]
MFQNPAQDRDLDSAKLKTVNGDVRIQALVDRKKIIVHEASIRCDLKLEDAEGTACLPNATIFEELIRMRKEAKVSQDETTYEEHIPTTSNDPPPSGDDRMQLSKLMNLCLKQKVKQLEKKKKSRSHRFRRLYKVGSSRRIKSSKESLGTQEDASKQGRKIADLDADAEVTLVDETQGGNDADMMFDIGVLEGDKVVVETKETVSTAATLTSSILISVANVEVTTTDAPTTTNEELTLA